MKRKINYGFVFASMIIIVFLLLTGVSIGNLIITFIESLSNEDVALFWSSATLVIIAFLVIGVLIYILVKEIIIEIKGDDEKWNVNLKTKMSRKWRI